jgi:hypothetical protein
MNERASTSRLTPSRCRGSVYVIVLASAMLLVTIGVGAALAARTQLRNSRLTIDTSQAREIARLGIDLAAMYMRNDANWRTSRTSGAWLTNYAVPGGTCDVYVTDPVDGDLSNDADQEVQITSIGYTNSARYKLQCRMKPSASRGMTSLAYALTSNGNIAIGIGYGLTASGSAVATNGNFIANLLSTINAGVEVGGGFTLLSLGTLNGYVLTNAATKEVPTASTLFSTYGSLCTDISILSLEVNGSSRRMRNVLLAPLSNPYGATNAAGIYRIDCAGTPIEIRDCRIVGTLILISPGSGSVIQSGMIMQTNSSSYPTLLVNGNMSFNISSTLSESNGAKLNPAGTPYNGVSNSDSSDTWPSYLQGLFYISGNATFNSTTTLTGGLITGGTTTLNSSLTITPDSSLYTSPPVGFTRSTRYMVFVPGSWKRMVD